MTRPGYGCFLMKLLRACIVNKSENSNLNVVHPQFFNTHIVKTRSPPTFYFLFLLNIFGPASTVFHFPPQASSCQLAYAGEARDMVVRYLWLQQEVVCAVLQAIHLAMWHPQSGCIAINLAH